MLSFSPPHVPQVLIDGQALATLSRHSIMLSMVNCMRTLTSVLMTLPFSGMVGVVKIQHQARSGKDLQRWEQPTLTILGKKITHTAHLSGVKRENLYRMECPKVHSEAAGSLHLHQPSQSSPIESQRSSEMETTVRLVPSESTFGR